MEQFDKSRHRIIHRRYLDRPIRAIEQGVQFAKMEGPSVLQLVGEAPSTARSEKILDFELLYLRSSVACRREFPENESIALHRRFLEVSPSKLPRVYHTPASNLSDTSSVAFPADNTFARPDCIVPTAKGRAAPFPPEEVVALRIVSAGLFAKTGERTIGLWICGTLGP
jgi:hypothetical protein